MKEVEDLINMKNSTSLDNSGVNSGVNKFCILGR